MACHQRRAILFWCGFYTFKPNINHITIICTSFSIDEFLRKNNSTSSLLKYHQTRPIGKLRNSKQ